MKKIAEFLGDTSHLKHCTKESPMPKGADTVNFTWIHHDVTELAEEFFKCNLCGHEFVIR